MDEVKRINSCGGIIMTSEQYDVMDDTIISSEPKRERRSLEVSEIPLLLKVRSSTRLLESIYLAIYQF